MPNPVRTVISYQLAFCGMGLLLCLFSLLQKLVIGVPVGKLQGYLIPTIFGGLTGMVLNFWYRRQKNAVRKLQVSEQRFRDLYINTPGMLHSIDKNLRLVEVSNHWLEKMGYKRKDVLGRPFPDFMTPNSRRTALEEVIPRFLATGSVHNVPYQLVTRDGDILDVLLSAISQKDERGDFAHSLAVITDITARKLAESKIEKLAYFDTLTGLPNRKLFLDRLQQSLAAARRHRHQIAVLFIDLDHFKGINDTLGHAQGDLMLRAIAERLQQCVREEDTVARLGGDEFVIILGGSTESRHAADFAQRTLGALSQPVEIEERALRTTASIGIALYPDHGGDASALLRAADIAMYGAKDQGRNTFQIYSNDMRARTLARVDLENRLHLALEREELFLRFQPQVHLGEGRIIGVEALLRWQHPEKGELTPGHFIDTAEESGLVIPIGDWVLRQACRQAYLWQQQGLPQMRVAVNLSARQFNQPHFIDTIDRILKETGLPPQWLEFEITESALMENVLQTVMLLTDLKVRDIRISIDDFGTGYSSLSYLKNFPIHRIKIAQEFVRDIPANTDDAAIVETVITMARHLGLGVIAEGVEKPAQVEFLRQRGCLEMQGFHFARPLLPDEISARVGEKGSRGAFCLYEP